MVKFFSSIFGFFISLINNCVSSKFKIEGSILFFFLSFIELIKFLINYEKFLLFKIKKPNLLEFLLNFLINFIIT